MNKLIPVSVQLRNNKIKERWNKNQNKNGLDSELKHFDNWACQMSLGKAHLYSKIACAAKFHSYYTLLMVHSKNGLIFWWLPFSALILLHRGNANEIFCWKEWQGYWIQMIYNNKIQIATCAEGLFPVVHHYCLLQRRGTNTHPKILTLLTIQSVSGVLQLLH